MLTTVTAANPALIPGETADQRARRIAAREAVRLSLIHI